jgi:hypothetical protein
MEIENNGQAALAAFIKGVEDESSPEVSLTALKGLAKLLPALPAHHVHHATATLGLKVRPFFESSSEDHRAASISVYGSLAIFAEGEHKTSYIDQCHSILVPLLLHSSSPHQDTRDACLSTLTALSGVINHQPLIEVVANHNTSQDFSALVGNIVESKCEILIEMYATFVANGISYFRSSNAMLRKNAVLLLRHLLCYSGPGDESSLFDDDLVTAVTGGVVDLLKDSDCEVRKVAAGNLGKIVEKYTK